MGECSSSRRNLDKAINATFTDDEFRSDNQSEKSTHEESEKYVAFTTKIRSESDKVSDKAKA